MRNHVRYTSGIPVELKGDYRAWADMASAASAGAIVDVAREYNTSSRYTSLDHFLRSAVEGEVWFTGLQIWWCLIHGTERNNRRIFRERLIDGTSRPVVEIG